ncbi:transport permease protein [Alicyclobacillus contaminans]|uniref:ABC transporter permease n=1 Tax=Alicyclobacillus contaminans TaxID=392016 RepID=UPI00047BB0E2|nr:ABC transporter permease [Alicyclobacillus contaminans]GMA51484.1 transport permease protein [Alicyclobacillus contaminans]
MSSEAVAPHAEWGKPRHPAVLFLVHVAAILEMEARKLRKDPTELLMRGVQPALWLLVFGQAFSRFRVLPTGSVSYKAFLTPGILAQSITFISIFYGIAIIWERDMGLLQKVATTPIRKSALALGKMLSASIRSLGQAVIILVLALILQIHLHLGALSILGVLLMVILGGAFFSGLSMVIAAIVRTRERMMGIGQLITMPLFFSSNALYPMSVMPGWLKVIATINPMSYLVDGLRGLLIATPDTHFGLDVLVLVVAGLLMLALNTVLYPRILAG